MGKPVSIFARATHGTGLGAQPFRTPGARRSVCRTEMAAAGRAGRAGPQCAGRTGRAGGRGHSPHCLPGGGSAAETGCVWGAEWPWSGDCLSLRDGGRWPLGTLGWLGRGRRVGVLGKEPGARPGAWGTRRYKKQRIGRQSRLHAPRSVQEEPCLEAGGRAGGRKAPERGLLSAGTLGSPAGRAPRFAPGAAPTCPPAASPHLPLPAPAVAPEPPAAPTQGPQTALGPEDWAAASGWCGLKLRPQSRKRTELPGWPRGRACDP